MNAEELNQLIGSVLVAGFPSPTVDEHVMRLITDYHVSNLIFFSRNVENLHQVKRLTESLKELAKQNGIEQLMICIDEENGVVARMPSELPSLPGNMVIGAAANEDLARQVGNLTGLTLRDAGIMFNLAPVVDVNNNPHNPVIGVRSFGENSEFVASLSTAMIEGMQEVGVAACAKHFPGHGDVAQDSHLSLPVVQHDKERLRQVELLPFRHAIEHQVAAIMTAHILFTSVNEKVPATMCKEVLTDLMRDELGFQGVVITDCLEMNAISEVYGVGEGAVQALLAGADLILVSHRLDRQIEAIEAIKQAVIEGRLPQERLAEAVHRVKALKMNYAQNPLVKSLEFEQIQQNRIKLASTIAERAITYLQKGPSLTINEKSLRRIWINSPMSIPTMEASGVRDSIPLLQETLRQAYPQCKINSLHDVKEIDGEFNPSTDVIFIWVNGKISDLQNGLMKELDVQKTPYVVVALRSPYDVEHIQTDHMIFMYEDTPIMLLAAMHAIFTGKAKGKLPVTIA
nr:beta-N-acetylhexosaminidase [Bacilli bacterium]